MNYRTIFISDTHLAGACDYEALHSFLHDNHADTWYIVGDFIDFWALRRNKKWPAEASLIIQKLLREARKGSKIILLPGNHDPELRSLEEFKLANIEVVDKAVFETASGKKYIVIHGDLFDTVIGHATWIAQIGAIGYDCLVWLNHKSNWIRKIFKLSNWSLSAAIKKKVKSAVNYISNFETSLSKLASQEGVDGVICGHIHTAEIKLIDQIIYINTGDWVESRTAVVEHPDGVLELKHY
jgi:UDP-2,3-diacylglucosamine pyrophosphatase LpxH